MPLAPAPIGRRFGAFLLDSAVGTVILLIPTLLPLVDPHPHAPSWFPISYFILLFGWILGKDALWPGQGLGKRVAHILIALRATGDTATRLRCVWRQIVYFAVPFAVVLPFVFLSVARPRGTTSLPEVIILFFIIIESLMVLCRRDHRRIVDFLAGTQVVAATSESSSRATGEVRQRCTFPAKAAHRDAATVTVARSLDRHDGERTTKPPLPVPGAPSSLSDGAAWRCDSSAMCK